MRQWLVAKRRKRFGRKRKWVFKSENHVFHNRKCLTMNCYGCHIVFVEIHEDVTVNDIFIVDSQSFNRWCNKMPSFHSLGIPLWS